MNRPLNLIFFSCHFSIFSSYYGDTFGEHLWMSQFSECKYVPTKSSLGLFFFAIFLKSTLPSGAVACNRSELKRNLNFCPSLIVVVMSTHFVGGIVHPDLVNFGFAIFNTYPKSKSSRCCSTISLGVSLRNHPHSQYSLRDRTHWSEQSMKGKREQGNADWTFNVLTC